MIRALIQQGVSDLSLNLTDLQLKQMEQYLDLLFEWNKKFNLTAIKTKEAAVIYHLLDSLIISPFLKGKHFMDVGSGGGLPGIPLAIVNPNLCFYLLESKHKKITFLQYVVEQLQLNNCSVIHARAEQYQPELKMDCVITRAFSSLDKMLNYCQHLINQQGYFLALKGKVPHDELKALGSEYKVDWIKPLQVPNLDANRCCIKLINTKK